MPRAVVTGASGHLGANLVRLLLDKGYAVRAVVRDDLRAIAGLSLEPFRADICDVSALRKAFQHADIVFHLAAIVALGRDHSGRVWRTNVDGVRNVVDACARAGVRRLVHYSSIHAFSAYPIDEVVTEARPCAAGRGLPSYDRTKVAGEQEALRAIDSGVDVVIINPTAVIGPCDYKPSPMGRVLLDLQARRMPALVNGGFNWVDARDVSVAAETAGRLGRSGERYLVGGNYATLREIADLAATVTGVAAPRLVMPVWLAMLGVPFAAAVAAITGKDAKFTRASLRAVTHHQKVSHEKAERELGYRPRPLRETLTDTYRWFRENGYTS